METSYHEAAHAVAAIHFGFRIRLVTLEPHKIGLDPEQPRLGLTIGGSPPSWLRSAVPITRPAQRRDAETWIIMAFVGDLAVTRYRGQSPGRLAGSESDYGQSAHIAIRLSDNEHQDRELWMRLWTAACDFVQHPARWTEIEAVARRLQRQQAMTGRQVRAILRRVHHEREVGDTPQPPKGEKTKLRARKRKAVKTRRAK